MKPSLNILLTTGGACLAWLLAGCASPAYQKETRESPIARAPAKGTETMVINPARQVFEAGSGGIQVNVIEDTAEVKAAVAAGEAVMLRPSGQWHLEFDLSQLPPEAVVTEAVLELHVRAQELMARSLSAANLAEIAPDVFPTPFFQSTLSLSGGRGVRARDSTVKWKTHTWSLMSWGGGNGGRLVFVTEGPGIDRWNLTDYVAKARAQKRPFSLYVGFAFDRLTTSGSDLTMFSGKVLLGAVALSSTTAGSAEERPRLIITYR